MRRYPILFLLLLLAAPSVQAQFRGHEPRLGSPAEQVRAPQSSSLLFGFINPDNFQMNHSVSMSYMSMGPHSIGVSMYTNSMLYKIAEPLTVRADVSIMATPFGSATQLFNADAGKIFLQRAQIDYTPSKDTRISLSFRQFPYEAANPYLYGRGMTGYMGSMWYDDWP